MAKKRKQIDWEAVGREVQAGQLSIREIGRQFNVSDKAVRNKIAEKGWTRDLTSKVRQKVRTELVRTEVRTSNADQATEDEIVSAAADRGVQVVQLHRKDINSLRELEAKLLTELGGEPTKLYITQYQGQIVQEEVAIAVTERASALQALAGVQHKRIQLERQAFNLDEKAGEVSDLESVLSEVASRNSGLIKDDGDSE